MAVEKTARVLALGKVPDDVAANGIRDIIKLYSAASPMCFAEWQRYQHWKHLHADETHTDDMILMPPYGKNARQVDAVDEASLTLLMKYAADITQLAAIDNGVLSMLDAYASGVPVDDILA